MAVEFIFVYGTLRREAASSMHHLLSGYCEYFADGYMQGKLYEIDGYPGFTESGNVEDQVHGELYKIINGDLLFTELDEYEACSDKFPQPHEYVRKKLPVSVASNELIDAWVYVFNYDVSDLRQIESGNYLSLKKN